MASLIRRLLRLFAVVLATAPFVFAASAMLQGTTSLVVVAYAGIVIFAAFFIAPAALGAIIWWLAGFIRDPDDAEIARLERLVRAAELDPVQQEDREQEDANGDERGHGKPRNR